MDNQQFMAQMAQFSALEQSQRLNDKVQQLTDSQAALQSIALIGRTVDLQTASGAASGTVSALSLQGDAPLLAVTLANGTVLKDLALSQVLSVH
jgi:flagellar basal-body rod modification protein FlgD